MDIAEKNFLSIQPLSFEFILSFFKQLEKNKSKGLAYAKPVLAGETVGLVFLEASTRTRMSFEIAAKRLGADTLLIQKDGTSLEKGETVLDTFRTMHAMGCRYFVYRATDASIHEVARHFGDEIALINAGDGIEEHPTQALIDAYTMWERYRDLKKLKIAIVGDIARSRVAKSNILLLNKFENRPYIYGPSELLQNFPPEKVHVAQNIDEAVKDADVVMMLRIQKERNNVNFSFGEKEYLNMYGLTQSRLALAKSNAMVMHPGPLNREVEIESAVADGAQSFILHQVNNGVWVRMLLLESLAKGMN